jgi:cytoskeletal protein CcmA (bactofilin family)
MVFRTHSRLAQVSTVLFAVAALGCTGGDGPRMLRNGDDVLMVGGAPFVRALDSVAGDAILSGRDVNFEGSAGGDYLGAGGNQNISGRIHGSVRSVGGEINARGTVDRNATIAGGNVSLDSSAVIGGNAYIVGGSVTIDGAVRGSLMASGGDVTVNGAVGRDVELSAGAIHIGPRAQIAGNLRYRGDKSKVKIDPGAHIGGTITALPVNKKSGTGNLIWLLGFAVTGIVVVALFPRFTTEAAETLYQRPIRSALAGLAWVCLLPFAMVIAAVTVIGIPLAIAGFAAWILVIFIGDLPVGLWIGKKLLGARARPGRTGAIFSILVGGLILAVLGLIPVVGLLVGVIAGVVGAGALVLRARGPLPAQGGYAT